MQNFIDARAAATRVGVSERTLSNWRSSGKGPDFYKLGGKILYKIEDLDAWTESCKRKNVEAA